MVSYYHHSISDINDNTPYFSTIGDTLIPTCQIIAKPFKFVF